MEKWDWIRPRETVWPLVADDVGSTPSTMSVGGLRPSKVALVRWTVGLGAHGSCDMSRTRIATFLDLLMQH